jgi:hypothetical protein
MVVHPRKGLNIRYEDVVADYLKRLKFCSVDGKYNPATLCALCERQPAARVYVHMCVSVPRVRSVVALVCLCRGNRLPAAA